MKKLAELQAECDALGIQVATQGRAAKEAYVAALRAHHWHKDHPGQPLPPQVLPMLLGSWEDLNPAQAEQIEQEASGWIVQPKLDGVRALLHIEEERVRITSRHVSVVTYRLAELQDNLLHLREGLGQLAGTVLDGELTCPCASIQTDGTTTAHALQAAMAILATSPSAARDLQERHNAWLRFHAFDVLRFRGDAVLALPLVDRLDVLARALAVVQNPYLESVPSFAVGKAAVHRRVIQAGGEGTVWKRLDGPYESGRRARQWLKRKAEVRLEAFVTGFKAGESGNGHALLVGAVEFSVNGLDGSVRPVAWVSGWSDAERHSLTWRDRAGGIRLNPAFLGRRAVIAGKDRAAKSQRLQHARFLGWIDP
ncbi:MAG: hypothetical protein L0Z62_45000 [Gemmataceae bacterium]|nr:hypothetical protein [Gemmataceae bacterium]